MSALGQKQTLRRVQRMSALPPKADIDERDRHVRSLADIEARPFDVRFTPKSGAGAEIGGEAAQQR
jgi:hypothetical protein